MKDYLEVVENVEIVIELNIFIVEEEDKNKMFENESNDLDVLRISDLVIVCLIELLSSESKDFKIEDEKIECFEIFEMLLEEIEIFGYYFRNIEKEFEILD